MLDDLAEAIEGLDIPVHPDAVVRAIALRDRLEARIAEATAAVETTGWWMEVASASDGVAAGPCPHDQTGRQRLLWVARRLRALPVCARAYADGTLSGGQVEAIVTSLDDEVVELFAAHEAELVPYLAPLTVAGVSRAMSAWVSRARPEPAEPKEPERALHLSKTRDDRHVLDGCAWPRPSTPSAARRPGGETPWSTCAASSSTTTTAGPALATAPT